jgi:phage replication initiation protein
MSRPGAGAVVDSLRETRARTRLNALGRNASRAARGGREAAPCAARGASPRPVTTGGKSAQSAIVDWLNVTFDFVVGVPEILAGLQALMGTYVGADDCAGRYAFEHGVTLKAWAGGQLIRFGQLHWGGESQRGRALLSIEGGGCRHIADWEQAREWIEDLPRAKITRCDLAVDLYEGEYSVDDCADWVEEGRFNTGGRHPKTKVIGDVLERDHGVCLYVGKIENGKMLRCYEKGKQLGDLASEWTRFEAQFGAKDREIPFSILTQRDAFFAGAYPVLSEVLGVVGDRIRTTRTTTAITCDRALDNLRRTYGKYIGFFSSLGIEPADLVEAVRVHAVPSRLNLASVADAGIAATVHAVFSERNRHAIHGN